MKRSRFLLYLLAAISCALTIPACGGGGGEQDNNVSVQQFASGGKKFRFTGSPDIEVYMLSGATKHKLTAAGVKNFFKTPEYGPAANLDYYAGGNTGEINADSDGVFTTGGVLHTPAGNLSCDVAYGTSDSGARGYLYIAPQDSSLDSGNSNQTTKLVHFLGGVTRTDISSTNGNYYNSDASSGGSDIYSRFVIYSLAGATYRAELDFTTGTCNFYMMYAAQWDAVALDNNGAVIENAGVPMQAEIAAAKRTDVLFFVEAR